MTTERKPRSVREQIAKRLGVEIAERQNPLVASVGVADVTIARNDPGRVSLTIINLSANTIYVRPVNPATIAAGILLSANGGSLTVSMDEDFMLPTYEWHAIATAALSAIFVTESIIL
jgi:hypothetical protein